MENSLANPDDVQKANERVFWSLGILILAGVLLKLYVELVFGNPSSTLDDKSRALGFARLVGFSAGVWYLICMYRLSLALEPKKSVAFGMVALQFIPVVNLWLLVSICFKAWKISQAEVALKCPSCSGDVSSRDAICRSCNHSLSTDESFSKLIDASKAKGSASAPNSKIEKNRIASEGYEAFKSGTPKSANPYRNPDGGVENADHVSFWDRGYALAENRKNRGEVL